MSAAATPWLDFWRSLFFFFQLLVQAPIEVGRGDAPRDPHGRLVVDPFVPEELVAMWASPPCLWVYHLPGDAVGLSVRSARGWTGAAASALR